MMTARTASLLFTAMVTVLGCGGATTINDFGGSSGGASSDSGTGGDGGGADGGAKDAATSPMCPAAAPPSGVRCSVNGVTCEYGGDPNPACNSVLVCVSGTWEPLRSGSCTTGGQCPATYAAVPLGKECTPDGQMCPYPQATCACSGAGPVYSQTPHWQCILLASGCPARRPALGTTCSQPNLECNYGACSGGVAEVCKQGFWQSDPIACPL